MACLCAFGASVGRGGTLVRAVCELQAFVALRDFGEALAFDVVGGDYPGEDFDAALFQFVGFSKSG